MSFPFDPQEGLIIVRAELWGPTGSVVLPLATFVRLKPGVDMTSAVK